ncbi:50S ribosomal protein L19e [Candidatus Micrarchaeota archaeon CG_4_10_14_0_2_um_filter_60_11]|nr:MAG: 50S ribosomal protein L19e [Candidatus Micrarchaeota archaeon CG09_land_8_20_14_0_10_60_16]PIY91559.1 MAG: 50S ribosomal protein L19e [Candidatus Micrarchaeota archaeon CG_4_10_14_0_8_um_filter_60_7]PIZ90838.1 MAG: 50S ribosomal protein L19e [Candidatus Micrarchaeota archaeon CG_4_10_14_0_2_um_filter_60_11]
MTVQTIKRLAAKVLKCGENRVRIVDLAKARDSLTTDDVRGLIKEGAIQLKPSVGQSRAKARFKAERRNAGRRRGEGSRKGTYYAKHTLKQRWMKKVRSQRGLLHQLKPRLVEGAYAKLYKMVKGNNFKAKRQLVLYVEENKLLK